jgi:hypothetical protein
VKSKKPKLNDEGAQSRYRRISTRIWNDRGFSALSKPQPNAQSLFFYLLTNPNTTGVPGLFRARETTMAEDLGWSLEGLRAAFAELREQRMAEADWRVGLVWLPNAVRHDPPASPNVVVAWGKIVRNDLPECSLVLRAISKIREQLRDIFQNRAAFEEAFAKAFPKAFLEGLGKAFPEAFGEAFQEALPEPRRPTPDAGSPTPDAGAGGGSPQPFAKPSVPVAPPPDAPPLMDELAEIYRAEKGHDYGRSFADETALRVLFTLAKNDEAQIKRRFRNGLRRTRFPLVASLKELARAEVWNHCATDEPAVVLKGTGTGGRASNADKDWSKEQPTTADGKEIAW